MPDPSGEIFKAERSGNHDMAKHGKGRRKGGMSKYVKGNIDETLDLGTLAARTLVAQVFDETFKAEARLTSLVASYSLSGYTLGNERGPVMVGIAHDDYSAAEIEEYIENTGSWNIGNMVSQEIAKRKVRIIGVFPLQSGGNVGDAVVLNEGLPVKTKLNWFMTAGASLDLWAYNLGSSAFASTTPDIHMQGHANIFY